MSAIAALLTFAALAGPLPGTPFDLGVQAGYAGVARDSVRQVLAAPGVRLLVARDRRDRALCVGYRQQVDKGIANVDFRCFGPGVAAPVIAYAARSGSDVDRVDSVTIVGVVREGVPSVEIDTEPVVLRALPGVGFRAFAHSDDAKPLPLALRVDGRELPLVALGEPPCMDGCIGAKGPWVDVVDAGG